jgi:hypothetical protein
MVGTLREYKINKGNVFETSNDKKQEKEQGKNKKSTKPAGRPKKSEVCDKKVIIYFTENELNDILQKTGSIATSPFLKKIILDNLK